jgi:hypothetical protein
MRRKRLVRERIGELAPVPPGLRYGDLSDAAVALVGPATISAHHGAAIASLGPRSPSAIRVYSAPITRVTGRPQTRKFPVALVGN